MSAPAQERPTPDALSVAEIAQEYGVDRFTILRRIRDGELKPINTPKPFGKQVRMYWVSRTEVERFLQHAS